MSLSNYPTIRPSLILDFQKAEVVDPRITFTRASSATRFNSYGVLETVANDIPRIDFNPTTLVCNGLLVEESRTNSIRNNTMVGAAAGTPGTLPTNWTNPNTAGLTTNVSAIGTQNGISYIDVQVTGTTNATSYTLAVEAVTQIAALQGQTWTFSSWISLIAGDFTNVTAAFVDIRELNSGGSQLASGAVSISLPSSTFQRIVATRTNTEATTAFVQPRFRFTVNNTSAVNFTLRIGLPQLEQGAFATSVIPTSTVAVTRQADVASMTGTNFSSWYNAAAGTVVWSASTATPDAGSPIIFTISDGSNENRIAQFISSNLITRLRAFNTTYDPAAVGSAVTANTQVKGGVAYATNSAAATLRGVTPTTSSTVVVPAVTRLSIGYGAAVASLVNGTIQRISYYPARLTNAQLQALTAT